MKHIFSKSRRSLLLLSVFLAMAATFTSCSTDDDYIYSTDPALYGFWELTYANSVPVVGFQKNFFQFDASGQGDYQYYYNGQLFGSYFVYWCTAYNYSYSTLNINYDDGRSSTMQYYFDRRGNLVMTWNSPQGRMNYIYTRTVPF